MRVVIFEVNFIFCSVNILLKINMKKAEDKQEKKPIIVRNSVDLQRLKLEKLMANPVS